MAKPAIKNKRKKRAVKLIKDKAIINFLLEHMKPSKIDFSKVKIPSFLNILESEGEKNNKKLNFFYCINSGIINYLKK